MTQTSRRLLLTMCALSTLTLTGTGCANLTGARPLAPGEHTLGATFGGPTVLLGGTPIPLPNVIASGRSGVATILERNLEVDYGLNATAIAFGIVQAHVGSSYQLLHQSGALPALALTNRVYLAINPLDLGNRDEDAFGFWGADQLELTASWTVGDQHLAWVALGQYFDFFAPQLLLSPAVGFALDLGEPRGWGLQFEARWYGVNALPEVATVRWFPGGPGSLGFSLGVSYAL